MLLGGSSVVLSNLRIRLAFTDRELRPRNV